VTRLRLIGVPSSAGAHAPGLEQGPAKLRAAGLAGALAAAGVMARDWGDLPVSSFATTTAESGARNLPAVMEVVSRVADAVAAEHALAWRFILYADGIGRGEKAERRA